MGRSREDAVKYYSIFTTPGRTVKMLDKKYPNNLGYGFIYKLFNLLATEEGHFYDCSTAVNMEHLAQECGVDVISGEKMLADLHSWGKLNTPLWEKYRVIWYQGWMDNALVSIYAKRGRPMPTIEEACEALGIPVSEIIEETAFPGRKKVVSSVTEEEMVGNDGFSEISVDNLPKSTPITLHDMRLHDKSSSSKPSSSLKSAAPAADEDVFSENKNGEGKKHPVAKELKAPKSFFDDWPEKDRNVTEWRVAKSGKPGSYPYELARAICRLQPGKNPILNIGGYMAKMRKTWEDNPTEAVGDWVVKLELAEKEAIEAYKKKMSLELSRAEAEKEANQNRLVMEFRYLPETVKKELWEKAVREWQTTHPNQVKQAKLEGKLSIDHPEWPKIAPYIAEQMDWFLKKRKEGVQVGS